MQSKHSVRIGCLVGHDLQNIPMLDDLALFVEAKNVVLATAGLSRF
jgi:hypothetical protein